MEIVTKDRIAKINNGQVPEGYEKTSFGIFPCDWIKVSLGEVSSKKGEYGLNAPACEYEEGLPKYIRITDIDEQGRYVDNNAYVNDVDSNKYILQNGDIVFARTGASVGKNYIYDKKDGILVYAGFLIKFSIKPEYNPYIVCANCRTKKYENWVAKISARSGQPGINAEEYATYSFILPKTEQEQSRIAQILMQWDKTIELQEKYIASLEDRKKALMQRLLTPKEGINSIKLVELVKMLTSGGTPLTSKVEYYDGNIIWVSIEDMSKSNKYISDSIRKITQEGLDNSSAKLFPKGTVLYAMYASIGKCVIAGRECATSQAILGISCDENKLYNEYLYYYLCSIQEKIILQGQKGVQANLNKEMVAQFSIPVKMKNNTIDISWQKNIANILSQADQEISLQKQKLQNLIAQRKALMQVLLTGIVRV